MPGMIGLDFETYGAEDLPTHGLDRYVHHPTFRPLMARGTYRDESGALRTEGWDFTERDIKITAKNLKSFIGSDLIVAHNAPFEKAVLHWLGLDYGPERFIDSAVVARAVGAGGKLEAAAPQLLGTNKLEMGRNLIRLFSIPGPYQEQNGDQYFDPQVVADNPNEWADFWTYCGVDAELGLQIVEQWLKYLTPQEQDYNHITLRMNQQGWTVDMKSVLLMQERYLANLEAEEHKFRLATGAQDLNFNSLKQLKEWCLDRGVRASSFDEKHVARLIKKLEAKVAEPDLDSEKKAGYTEVLWLAQTKQMLGGSSLKKLQTIIDLTRLDEGRYVLRDQYLHCGAGQTLRTTGKGVQMQNLKRLPLNLMEMENLIIEDFAAGNEELAANLRQVFVAMEEKGRLIVGDFSSVESRGLAYLAGAEKKLQAFRDGLDIYKVGAAEQYGVPYDAVNKDQRQFGKVGELSCGYQAGWSAVQAFAEGMGVELSEGEARKIVFDWRMANPLVVDLWEKLDEMLHRCVELGSVERHELPYDNLVLFVAPSRTPESLTTQHDSARSIEVSLFQENTAIMRRYFHGCYLRGNNIGYYKPSELKSGDLWKNHYRDPKTGLVRFYEIYGGKLSGILTQSFCREIFFMVLKNVERWVNYNPCTTLVGQFHDEIVVDWAPVPGAVSCHQAEKELTAIMSDPGRFKSFPLTAEVKSDYRYIK